MRHLLLYLILSVSIYSSFAQNTGIGIGTVTPHQSAQLDVTASNKGFLPPRMTAAQRDSILNPAAGLIIYCTNCGVTGDMQYYDGSTWRSMNMGLGVAAVFPAVVETAFIFNISATTAACGGNVTADSGLSVTSRGVCWSTSPNPTVSLSTKTTNGSGIGSFAASITGLSANTTYYVRAYATNSSETAYGAAVIFTTSSSTAANLPNVAIGNQIWQSENLDVATYRNGNAIPEVTDATQWLDLTTGAWCWYNNDSATYAATYGRLYNWYAVVDFRGLCPTGWHVPSDWEWTTLTNFLGGESVAGGKMKSTTGWTSPNTGATNSSGFTGLPGGYRFYNGFSDVGNEGYFWSSTEYDSFNVWSRFLYSSVSNVFRYYPIKQNGFSVRCLRD